jgi:CheY-like chemotaxis protein
MKLINLKGMKGEPARSFFGFRKPATGRLQLHVDSVVPRPRTGGTVLLVDDDPIILQTTGARLNAAGYDVITANDGAEAISALGKKVPQFILLDIHFAPDITNPGSLGWDGFRLMFWLRGLQNAQNARYIMLSAANSQELKDQARRSGAIGFFTKPIDHRELIAVLQQEECAQSASKEPRRWWTALFDFL